MLELTCAVLILASSVTPTPHGYGVKGGASSRAEALSGAFGGLSGSGYPVPVPLGASYSGSFSKSSSSSFASSSASSSSSSFTYSGSNAGGITGFGNNGASLIAAEGCGSGNCKLDGAHGLSNTHSVTGTGIKSYNTANTGATAGAISGSFGGPGCQGENCDNDSIKCTSGQCKPNTATDSSNKCSSGKCGSEQNANDIYINTDMTKLTHNAEEHKSDYDKEETSSGSGCSTGNCRASDTSNLHQGQGLTNSYGASLSNNNQHSTASDVDVFSGYSKPALNLEAPKFGSSCTSGSCGSGSTGSENSPSSYHVPIHGPYGSNDKKASCSGGNCDTSTNDTPLSTNYLNVQSASSLTTPNLSHSHSGTTPHNLPTSGTSSNCGSLGCGSYPGLSSPSGITNPSFGTSTIGNKLSEHTGGFGGSAGILRPNEFIVPALTSEPSSTYSTTPSFAASSIGSTAPDCKTPGCASYTPVTSVDSGVTRPSTTFGITPSGSGFHLSTAGTITRSDTYPGALGVTKPAVASSKEKLSTYTGGFGGPTGVLTPNEFGVSIGKPDTSSKYNKPSHNIGTLTCTSPNCSGLSNVLSVTGVHGQSSSNGVKPNIELSSSKEELYTGGFNGPAGVLSPVQSPHVSHVPNYSDSGIPPQNWPTYNRNTGTTGCKTLNCVTDQSTNAQDSSAGANADSISFNLNKPSVNLTPDSQKLPNYTGGFGGSTGIFKPNQIGVSTGTSAAPSGIQTGSPTFITPSASVSSGCKTSNCAYPTAAATADAHSSSLGGTESVGGLPTYTGGFGGPSGVYKPDENSVPASGPVTGGASIDCKTSNCVSANVHQPGYINSGTPSKAAPTITVGSNVLSGTNQNTKPNSGDLTSGQHPAYIGSFGGSVGVFKPNEGGAPTTPTGSPSFGHNTSPSLDAPLITGSAGIGCKTGNCDSYASSGAGALVGTNSQTASYDITKHSGSSEKDKLPAYTGGFGGPSGLLKPNEYTAPAYSVTGALPGDLHKPTGFEDNSKPALCASGSCAHHSLSPHTVHPGESSGIQTTAGGSCTTGSCATSSNFGHTSVLNGAHSIAGASADANAVAYTGGFGGPPGYLIPYDNTKFGAAGVAGKQTIGTQFGSHNSPNGVLLHDISGAGSLAASATQAGGTPQSGDAAQAGAVARAGASVTATSGAISGYNLHGGHKDQAGHGAKIGSSCSSGCGGDYSGSSNFGYSNGLYPSKLGYEGLSGSLSSSGASAKSLAGARAFSSGGTFASSSASAHASAGVKGGYGRR